MCFGNETEQKRVESTSSAPSWLTGEAQNNLNFAQNLQSQGFQPYQGQQVAGFSPQQQQSFGLGSDIAGGIAPAVGQTGGLLTNYANAGPGHVNAQSIASRMSPYMNQYVNMALQPQLQAQDLQFANQNKGVDSAASMAGAFGDTGWGQLRGTTTQAQDAARSGLVGNAYNAAFNTAIGAGAQDVSNNLNAQTTNAGLRETALNRQLTGANAIAGQGAQATNLENQLGGQQTAQSQADLNAKYNQWQLAQQYPFQTAQLVNQTIGAATPGAGTTGTQTTYAPDNSGYGMIGTALGIAAAPFTGGLSLLPAMGGLTNAGGLGVGGAGASQASMGGGAGGGIFSDPALKENAHQVGELYDGTPVHSFNYKGDPRTVIGLMAPEVKAKAPEAVDESGPFAKVDYSMATRRAAQLADDKKQPTVKFGIAA